MFSMKVKDRWSKAQQHAKALSHPVLPVCKMSDKTTREMYELERIHVRANNRQTILNNTRRDLDNPETKKLKDRMSRMRKSATKQAAKAQRTKIKTMPKLK